MNRLIELPAADARGYTPSLVRFAAEAWPMRAAEELRSAMVFRAIRRTALRVGGRAAELAPAAARIVRDELRHARLCTVVGTRWRASQPMHDLGPVHRRLDSLPEARIRFAGLLLVEAAIGETVSASLFAAGLSAAREPLTRAALRSILRDEVRHARFGWDASTVAWSLLGDGERAALSDQARVGLGWLENDVAVPALRRLEGGVPFEPGLAELGVLSPEARVDAFYGAIERRVIPRLHRLGIDGTTAWAERHRPTA